MNKFIIAIVFTLSITLRASAQYIDAATTTKRIEAYLDKMEKVGFYGSVLVELNGEKVLSKGYGYQDDEKHLKNKPLTIFNINSVTKQFTAAAVLKLEMQGRLSTDDKIIKYFANVPADKVNICIHDLLRNQSGLISNIGKSYDKIRKDDFVKTVFETKLLFEPGTQFSYSNIGYSLLAIIIEKASGMNYEDYLYENLFKPAGMEQTGTTRPVFTADYVSIGYYNDGRVWGKPTDKGLDKENEYWNTTGNGSILSNTEDLYKWHKALMSDMILSEKEKHKLYRPLLRVNEDVKNYYAYGWDVHTTKRNTLMLWHNGVNNIMYSDFKRFIDENVTIITLSNRANQNNFDAKISNDIEGIIFEKNYTPIIPIAENKENCEFTKHIINVIIDNGLQVGKDEYLRRGKGIDLISNIVNSKGYDLINEKKIDQAIALFEAIVFAFPESADAYDSLAEGYLKKGDKRSAIRYYEKSLELNPLNDNAAEMLKKLK